MDPALACMALVDAMTGPILGQAQTFCGQRCFSLQLYTLVLGGVPQLLISAWVVDAPEIARILLEWGDLALRLQDAGCMLEDGEDESDVAAKLLVQFSRRSPLNLSRLVSVSTHLVAGTYAVYHVVRTAPGTLSLSAIIPSTLSAASLHSWADGLVDEPLALVEGLRAAALEHSWLEGLLISYGLPLRDLPALESWGFWPFLGGVVTTLLRCRGSVATCLRLRSPSPLLDLAERLASREMGNSLDVLDVVLAPLATAMRQISNPADPRFAIAGVLDVVNRLRVLLQGESTVLVPAVGWPDQFSVTGVPLDLEVRGAMVADLSAMERRTGGRQAPDVRSAAQELLAAWLEYWQPLLDSDFARVLLLPEVRVKDTLDHDAAEFLHLVGLMQQDKQKALRRVRALTSEQAALTFRELWAQGHVAVDDPLFFVIAPALVAYRFVAPVFCVGGRFFIR